MIGRARSSYGALILRRRALRSIALISVVVLVAATLTFAFVFWHKHGSGERSAVLKAWTNGAYEEVYQSSGKQLEEEPLSSFWLMMRGFSSYQLATAQINTQDTLKFIDESIVVLRKALLVGTGRMEARVKYVLGKAYYQKGSEYADEAVSCLEAALAASIDAPDIHEYLGLSYAALHDYQNSVVAFTQALGSNPSDLLLLSIARSYLALGEKDSARAYLVRCAENSKDSFVVAQAKLLLGKALSEDGDVAGAEREFLSILEIDEGNAEAHFALGELYSAAGDAVKARAEWRKTLRIDPAHGPARARLSL
jgi:tetratricopeptide (TPR) repeat protein